MYLGAKRRYINTLPFKFLSFLPPTPLFLDKTVREELELCPIKREKQACPRHLTLWCHFELTTTTCRIFKMYEILRHCGIHSVIWCRDTLPDNEGLKDSTIKLAMQKRIKLKHCVSNPRSTFCLRRA